MLTFRSLQNVISRNTVSQQHHTFIIQGLDTLYLTFQPLFHHANGRRQLILRAEITDLAIKAFFQEARQRDLSAVFTIITAEATTIEDILASKTITGHIHSAK